FQEFMIQPWGFDDFNEALRAGVEVYHALRGVLHKKGLSTAVGDEGGFAPNLKTNQEALQIIEEAVKVSGYKWGEQILEALDPATSELWNEAAKVKKEGYLFFKSTKEVLSSADMVELWAGWCKNYPIRSLEDGLAENDWSGWKSLTQRLGGSIQLVGDDLFVNHPLFLQRRLGEGCADAIPLKGHHICTLSENLDARHIGSPHKYT